MPAVSAACSGELVFPAVYESGAEATGPCGRPPHVGATNLRSRTARSDWTAARFTAAFARWLCPMARDGLTGRGRGVSPGLEQPRKLPPAEKHENDFMLLLITAGFFALRAGGVERIALRLPPSDEARRQQVGGPLLGRDGLRQQREAGDGGGDKAELQPEVEVFCVVHVPGVFQTAMCSSSQFPIACTRKNRAGPVVMCFS